MLERIGYNLLQVLVVVALAPLIEGVITRLKEIIQSKRDPSIFQPYRDMTPPVVLPLGGSSSPGRRRRAGHSCWLDELYKPFIDRTA